MFDGHAGAIGTRVNIDRPSARVLVGGVLGTLLLLAAAAIWPWLLAEHLGPVLFGYLGGFAASRLHAETENRERGFDSIFPRISHRGAALLMGLGAVTAWVVHSLSAPHGDAGVGMTEGLLLLWSAPCIVILCERLVYPPEHRHPDVSPRPIEPD